MKKRTVTLLVGVCMMAGLLRVEEPVKPEGWETSLSLGLHATDGNSRTLLGNARLTAQREVDEHSFRLGLEGAYGETTIEDELGEETDQTTTQSARAGASYRRALNGTYFYADSAVLHDDIAEVDYRATVGVGLGYSLIKSDDTALGLEAGVGYLWEDVADVTDEYTTVRVAVLGERRFGKKAKIWESVEYVPRVEEFDDCLLAAEVGIEAAIDSDVSLQVVVRDRYDSRPAPGRKKNDLAVISALSWRL